MGSHFFFPERFFCVTVFVCSFSVVMRNAWESVCKRRIILALSLPSYTPNFLASVNTPATAYHQNPEVRTDLSPVCNRSYVQKRQKIARCCITICNPSFAAANLSLSSPKTQIVAPYYWISPPSPSHHCPQLVAARSIREQGW